MLRPLKLKMQRAPQPAGPAATDLPVASVWVDTAIPTLTEPFSYLIPEKLSPSDIFLMRYLKTINQMILNK